MDADVVLPPDVDWPDPADDGALAAAVRRHVESAGGDPVSVFANFTPPAGDGMAGASRHSEGKEPDGG